MVGRMKAREKKKIIVGPGEFAKEARELLHKQPTAGNKEGE